MSIPPSARSTSPSGNAGAAGVPSRARPRTVRVADMDRMSTALERIQLRCEELEKSMARVTAELDLSRLSLNGMRALQEVAAQEQYPLGRSLQRRLATRVVERLKPPPPSGLNTARASSSQRETRAKVTLAFDVDADLRSLDELVALAGMAYDVPGPRRRERSARSVQFSSAAALLEAIGMSEPLRKWCSSRHYTRSSDGSTPARGLLERYEDITGSITYVLVRLEGGKLLVASRETEEFLPLRRRFKHPLKRSTVSIEELPEVPDDCPAFLRWRPSTAAVLMGHTDTTSCGRLTLSLPCCVVEHFAHDVLGLVCGSTSEQVWIAEQEEIAQRAGE